MNGQKNIPILSGRKIVHDDRPIHIDDYGREQLEVLACLIDRIQTNDPELLHQGLKQVRDYFSDIMERYRE